MAIFLKRDVTFSDGTIRKGTEILPVRSSDIISRLEESFSSIWAYRLRKEYIACNIKGKDRWINRKDVC